MTTRYESLNEVTFESYCKAAVDRSVLRERLKKLERSKCEQTFSTFTDAMLYEFSQEDSGISQVEMNCRAFYVRGIEVAVHGEKLGQALSSLVPREREIILLYFFLGIKYEEIARLINLNPSTVSRRRKAAMRKLRDFLEDST